MAAIILLRKYLDNLPAEYVLACCKNQSRRNRFEFGTHLSAAHMFIIFQSKPLILGWPTSVILVPENSES